MSHDADENVQLPVPCAPALVAGGGASPFGNFHNYYSFNSVEQRFCFLPRDLAATLLAVRRAALGSAAGENTQAANMLSFLDIGCNEGNISLAMSELLARQLATSSATASANGAADSATAAASEDARAARPLIRGVGVDIDRVLIARAIAKTANSYPYSATTLPSQSAHNASVLVHGGDDRADASVGTDGSSGGSAESDGAAVPAEAASASSSDSAKNGLINGLDCAFELTFVHGNVMEPQCQAAIEAFMQSGDGNSNADKTEATDRIVHVSDAFPQSMLSRTYTARAFAPALPACDGATVAASSSSSNSAESGSKRGGNANDSKNEVTAATATAAAAAAAAADTGAGAVPAVTPAAQPVAAPLPAPLFDISFAFSVTLWIHLHHGDDGLRAFLRRLCALSRNVIIEPQPWKCYQTCRRRWRRAGAAEPPLLVTMQWRQDVDVQIVRFMTEQCGMRVRRRLGETKWERSMVWLTRAEDFDCGNGETGEQ